jgi:hypothetical protein
MQMHKYVLASLYMQAFMYTCTKHEHTYNTNRSKDILKMRETSVTAPALSSARIDPTKHPELHNKEMAEMNRLVLCVCVRERERERESE